MTTAEFAAFSDNATMFAGIVFVLALLAHVAEWASTLARASDVPAAADASGSVAVAVGPSPSEQERQVMRTEVAARMGVALTVVATGLLGAGVVTRSFAPEPWRVPWGHKYEFTQTRARGVSLI